MQHHMKWTNDTDKPQCRQYFCWWKTYFSVWAVCSLCSGARQMVDHLWLLQRPSIHYIHSHIHTETHKVIHKYTKCLQELYGFCLCVCTSKCGHIFSFACICAFTLGHLCCSMCLCVCLRLYCMSWWQTGSREEETQEAQSKIGSDSLYWCWWKIWLFPSSGVGFDISSPLSHSIR